MPSGRTLPQNAHDLQDCFDMLLLPHSLPDREPKTAIL
jgi:hypothetical protein